MMDCKSKKPCEAHKLEDKWSWLIQGIWNNLKIIYPGPMSLQGIEFQRIYDEMDANKLSLKR